MNFAKHLSLAPNYSKMAIRRRITFNVTGKEYAGHDSGD